MLESVKFCFLFLLLSSGFDHGASLNLKYILVMLCLQANIEDKARNETNH